MDHSFCNWKVNDFYRPIAEALIERYENLKHIPVETFLFVDNMGDNGKKANKKLAAKVYKIPQRYQDFIQQLTNKIPPQYVMEFFKCNIEEMSREQIVMVVYHELRHVYQDGNLILHGLEDWPELVGTFGSDWATTQSMLPDLISDEIDWETVKSRQLRLFHEPQERGIRAVR